MQTGDVVAGPRYRLRQSGFGYLLVLFSLAAMGLILAGTGQVWHTMAQRDREAELLFAGNQFRRAITSYHDNSPGAVKQYPQRLEDLLEDTRHTVPVRHLRRIYRDPMTGSIDWGLVLANGRIVAVHSRSKSAPIKTDFGPRDASLVGATRHDEWVFGHER